MNFRDRGHMIQIVRSAADPATGKSTDTVLGIVPKRTLEVDPDVMAKATPDEQAAIKAMVARYKRIQDVKAQAEAYSVTDVVRAAIQYYEGLSDAAERDMVREMMLEAARRLRRAAQGEEAGTAGAKGGGRGAGKKKAA